MSEQPQQDEQGQPVEALTARFEALRGGEPGETPQPETAEPDTWPDKTPDEALAEPQPRPAEGYDPHRQAWIKTFSLGATAPLHELGIEDAAAHEAAAGLPDGAARAAQDAGYTPTGAPELIDVRRNGLKSDLTYAVPAAERG